MPPGFEDDPTAVRTFDASGKEAGRLELRLNNNNFLNREGSGGTRAPMTRTG